jgi:hypothetical protein
MADSRLCVLDALGIRLLIVTETLQPSREAASAFRTKFSLFLQGIITLKLTISARTIGHAW